MAVKQKKNWAMVIDQERCIGCWTCAVGCTVINNEPLGFWWNRILIDYERCIGCRYCIAACPYGVRIFNWGEAKREPDFTVGYGRDYRSDGRLVFTPDRPVGVVEKCTMCVERIDVGEQPFCVDVCPTGARIFGDLGDRSSEVSQLVREGGAAAAGSPRSVSSSCSALPPGSTS